MVDPRTWLEHIPLDECWDLLVGEQVGRLAVVVDQRPVIFPLNFAVSDERTIVFRTAAGTKLEALGDIADCAFEADGVDPGEHSGWSVLVAGSARHVRDAASVERFELLDLEPWAPGHKTVWVEVTASQVSGRRIHPEAAEGQ